MRIPLTSLDPWNPFKRVVWHVDLTRPITRAEVRQELRAGRWRDTPIPDTSWMKRTPRVQHVRRIAYFARFGWADPIFLDVGVPSLGCYVDWIVQDGNHRLAAAFFREDEDVDCGIAGSLEYAVQLLDLPVEAVLAASSP